MTAYETGGMDYSPFDLLEMDEAEARETLTVDEYDRWEQIHDLHDQAEDNEAAMREQTDRVTDLTVHADAEQLGTEVDLYGNDVLVYTSSDDREFRQAMQDMGDVLERIDDATPDDADAVGDVALENSDVVDEGTVDALAEAALDVLDAMLVRWNGTEWANISEGDRAALLDQARAEWGIDPLVIGVFECVGAVNAEREDRVEAIKSFRGA